MSLPTPHAIPTILLVVFLLVTPPILSVLVIATAMLGYTAYVWTSFKVFAPSVELTFMEAAELMLRDAYDVFFD